MLLEVSGEVGDALRAVKEQLRAIPNGGIGYGLLRYLSNDADLVAQYRPCLLPKSCSITWPRKARSLSARPSPRCQIRSRTEQGCAPASAGNEQFRQHRPTGTSAGLQHQLPRPANHRAVCRTLTRALEAIIDHCLSTQVTSVPAQDIEDLYDLSLTQQGILFHVLDAPESGQFFMQSGRLIKGLDKEAFLRPGSAWSSAIRCCARHPTWKNWISRCRSCIVRRSFRTRKSIAGNCPPGTTTPTPRVSPRRPQTRFQPQRSAVIAFWLLPAYRSGLLLYLEPTPHPVGWLVGSAVVAGNAVVLSGFPARPGSRLAVAASVPRLHRLAATTGHREGRAFLAELSERVHHSDADSLGFAGRPGVT